MCAGATTRDDEVGLLLQPSLVFATTGEKICHIHSPGWDGGKDDFLLHPSFVFCCYRRGSMLHPFLAEMRGGTAVAMIFAVIVFCHYRRGFLLLPAKFFCYIHSWRSCNLGRWRRQFLLHPELIFATTGGFFCYIHSWWRPDPGRQRRRFLQGSAVSGAFCCNQREILLQPMVNFAGTGDIFFDARLCARPLRHHGRCCNLATTRCNRPTMELQPVMRRPRPAIWKAATEAKGSYNGHPKKLQPALEKASTGNGQG